MTSLAATASLNDHASLRNLVARVSGLLDNGDEPAERRIQRAGALLRDYPLQTVEGGIATHSALLAWQIRRLTNHIDTHLESSISVSHLANIAGLSPSYFCRAFRASLGESPHSFVMQRRIARSQLLMSTTCFTLARIAAECGFADQAHFSRVHSRLVGSPPGVWRRRTLSATNDAHRDADLVSRRICPALPSTVSAERTDMTAGRPISRAVTAPCDSGPPLSVITAAAL